MKYLILCLLVLVSCNRTDPNPETLAFIQIQDRNGVTETISNPDRLMSYETVNFLTAQPYKKVLRVYKKEGINRSKISSYHPNGVIARYLEAESMRANGAYREWFPNGQLKIEATVINGTADLAEGAENDWLFDGISQVWDEQGNLIAKINYEKGSLEGPSTYFFSTGALQRELLFVQNKMEREAVEYYPSGRTRSKITYTKGLKEGAGSVYSETGQLLASEEYKGDLLLNGKYHDLQGKLISEVKNGGGMQATLENDALMMVEFRMGRPDGFVRQFSSSGDIQKQFSIKGGKKQGEEIEFYLPGEVEAPATAPLPKFSLNWNDQMVHGPVKTWYPNGQLQSEREYARNQKTGSALAWYRNGALMMVEEYEEDLLVKGQYFKINKPEPTSSVLNGSGLAMLYDEAGMFIRKVSYIKGKPVDP